MKKKLVSLLLLVSMTAALLTGCGSEEPTAADESGKAATDTEQMEGEDNEEAGNEDEGENIVIALMSLAPIDDANSAHVEEKLNEILQDRLGITADFQWYDGGTYSTTVPMMITSGEQLDLMMFTPAPGAGYTSFMNQNQLMDITDYLEEYGTDIKETMGDYLMATSKEGRIYGVGNMTSLYATCEIVMRKDVLDELELTEKAESMTTWAEFQEILKEVVANTDLNGVVNTDVEGSVISPQPYLLGGDSFADAASVDTIGDSYQYVYADPDTDEVKCYFENESWLDSIRRVNQYYQEDLVYKDASTAQEYASSLLKNGVGFSMVMGAELGSKQTYESATGYEVLEAQIVNKEVTTGSFTKFGFAVPVTSEYPQTAIKVLNLMYSDQEFLDTLTWGVEGVDWEMGEDGLATYPEGIDSDSVQYHTADFLYGNRLMVNPWEGSDTDIRQQQQETNDTAVASKYLGFSVDTANVMTEITACKTVVDQYKPQLSSGIVEDVDGIYQEFMDALYGAGMQTILDEYQAQLDAWLAKQ